MRQVTKGSSAKASRISAVAHAKKDDKCPIDNRFQALKEDGRLDAETVNSLNLWAEKVNLGKPEPQSVRKKKSNLVCIKCAKDLEKLSGKMSALSLDNKSLSQYVKSI